ncbi:putative toxin-antitoxin system toxin component, PIN family [Acidimicrobium ferrooxidans]|uniref:putative toxin-antitoxin system toxin component, PIN family n=1 Tax=Acidimicrobium ferrooxidans TaxID=53635 RepID=UPI00247AD0B8|nr:putative toxin-antitoxin system toxin component, PIN family [Acidimicrobium ferrooxidans]
MGELRRVVFDTNVFVAAVTSRDGVCARLLLAATSGRYRLIVSPMLLDELSAVLVRPKFRRYLSVEDARRFVEVIRELADVVDDPPEEDDPITGDPDDDFLVLLAEVAGADVLVSGDPDLTTVQRPGLVVRTPRAFLEDLEQPI